MQSAKKSTKVLSALTMAAAAAASAQMAHAASLTLYYGQEASYANSNNGIFVATGYDPTGANTNTHNQSQFLSGTVVPQPSVAGAPVTVTVPVGSYLSMAIDAVLTGNPNAVAGTKQGGDLFTQPSFLGLSALGMTVSSTDLTGTKLTPYSTDTQVETTIGGLPTYNSTAILNVDSSPAPQAGLGTNSGTGYNALPNWASVSAPGGVQPNLPGYDTAPNSSGGVGLGSTSATGGAFPAGGNTGANARANGANFIEAFGSASNTASYGNATEFLDSLAFKALATGTVTLSPNVIAGATEYWKSAGNVTVSGKTASNYAATPFGGGDTITAMPVLVVNIVGPPSTGHSLVNYAAAANSLYNPSIGTLTVTGSNGSYQVAQITGLNQTTGTVEAKTFTPSTDEEIYALDVLVNGTQANATQLATLVTQINTFNGGSPGVTATTSSPVPDPFAANYNLFLDPSGLSDAFLGVDLSSSNDSLLQGYSFSAIAVVPEPMTLGLLALGGVGLMARRHRRKA
jgi:hypothetical protein